jgi:hypothetical protein
MKRLQIWIFGNPDYQPDALPLQIIPALKRRFPHFNFIVQDPHEEWKLPSPLIMIDTIKGIQSPTIFKSLDTFKDSPRVTLHDFDLITNLRWLAKLNQLPPFIIIGLPMHYSPKAAIAAVTQQLKRINSNSLPKSEPRNSYKDHTP